MKKQKYIVIIQFIINQKEVLIISCLKTKEVIRKEALYKL